MKPPTIIPNSRNNVVNVPTSEGFASIRYRNPGAQWPNSIAERYTNDRLREFERRKQDRMLSQCDLRRRGQHGPPALLAPTSV